MADGFTRGEWIAVAVASIAALWSTAGNWFVNRVFRNEDHHEEDAKEDRLRDQRLLQLESDHKAHSQQDDIRFGFIQQSLTRVEGYVAEIKQDVRDLTKRGERHD